MMLTPTDVPIHRPSVGAMGVALGSQIPTEYSTFRPYVYRGTGEDEHPEWDLDYYQPKPRPLKPQPADPEKARLREVARIKARAKREREQRWFAERVAEREAYRRSLVPEVMRPEVDHYEEPVQVYPQRKIRAAPGWKPMTGADIENLLQELGE